MNADQFRVVLFAGWEQFVVDPAVLKYDRIFEVSALAGEYSFYLSPINSEVRVKIWRDALPSGERYSYTISHYVHTPIQAGPYLASSPTGQNEEGALRKAIRDTLAFYEKAIAEGHEPSTDWLVPNDDF